MGRAIVAMALVAAAVGGCDPVPPAASTTPAPAASPRCDPDGPQIVFPTSPGGTPEASAEFVQAHGCQLRIVDVRERGELDGALGAIAGAEHVPQRRVAVEGLGWDRDAPVVLVCRSGRRSGLVARDLQAMGFSRVASLTGGMLSWRERGLPTVDGSSWPATTLPVRDRATMRSVSRDDIVAHVANRDRVRWTKAATLMLQGTQACIDGRDAHAIVGTPGGDAGELVLALATAERVSGRAFEPAEVERILDAYLDAFGHFYLHSDDHAVAALVDRLSTELPGAPLPAAHDASAAAAFMHAPPQPVRATLLDLVAEPTHVGCGHLRLMLQHPDEYDARPGLVAAVLRAFFRRLWDRHPAVEFVVLEGRHEESAVVTVELSTEVHPYTRIPLVSPRLGDTEIFVAHPQVARFVRRANAAFLLEQVPLLHAGDLDQAAFFIELEGLAERQQAATLAHLAPTLPRYQLEFSGESFGVVGPDALAESPRVPGGDG